MCATRPGLAFQGKILEYLNRIVIELPGFTEWPGREKFSQLDFQKSIFSKTKTTNEISKAIRPKNQNIFSPKFFIRKRLTSKTKTKKQTHRFLFRSFCFSFR